VAQNTTAPAGLAVALGIEGMRAPARAPRAIRMPALGSAC
jgi:hypothetical protein